MSWFRSSTSGKSTSGPGLENRASMANLHRTTTDVHAQLTKELGRAQSLTDSISQSIQSNSLHAPEHQSTDLPHSDDNFSAGSHRRYVLISPCRDEIKYIRVTLDSVLNQTIRPALWVIVDDGSTDGTQDVLADYASRFSFIKIITRTNRGDRLLGKGVIDTFNDGLKTVDLSQFDYVCKFDVDLDLPVHYFEGLIRAMEDDERLGACSGKPYFKDEASGQFIPEPCGDEHAVGMCKFYRVEAFEQMGGFVNELMWDGIDTHRSRMKGWKAASFNYPALKFTHLRPMGSSHKSMWRGRVRHGWGQWFMGTHPVYLLVSAMWRMDKKPVIVGSIAIMWGYFKGLFTLSPRYGDVEFRRFLRRYQMRCLTRGKARATAEIEEEQAAVWKPKVGK
jgi:poly-beta-1,6-N-acetyl-D-glucosamine synthase